MSAFVHNHPIVRELEPYMVVTDFNRAGLDSSPFGLTVPPKSLIDPTRMDSFDFLTLLQTLDARTFGPEGMPMDRWVFYTCCFMPGAMSGSLKVCISMYLAPEVGLASCTSWRMGKPDQGTTIDQASTQRWR